MSKYLIENTTLTAIADAVREKSGTTDLIKVSELPTAIASITAGAELEELNITSNGTYTASEGKGYSPIIVNVPQDGAPTAEDLSFSGSIDYLLYKGNMDWIVEKYGSLISFSDIRSAQHAFRETGIQDLSMLEIPFLSATISNLFYGSYSLKKLPKVSGKITRNLSNIFKECKNLTTDELNNFLSNLTLASGDTSANITSIIPQCYSLRDASFYFDWLDNIVNSYTGTSTNIIQYNQAACDCTSLDEINNLYVPRQNIARTSNCFGSSFDSCARVKNVIFKTDNGTPYTVRWKNQTIDLNYYVGYIPAVRLLLDYSSGITADKEVTDDATYQALKNDPDWFSTKIEYSRYNHDSAVNTINSLPDTSAYLATAGGTNTIKFKGASGSATDGGAINTLTEEEIAVAAAKGWTVTLA